MILLHVIKDFGDQEEGRRKKRKEKDLGMKTKPKTFFDDVWVWGKLTLHNNDGCWSQLSYMVV